MQQQVRDQTVDETSGAVASADIVGISEDNVASKRDANEGDIKFWQMQQQVRGQAVEAFSQAGAIPSTVSMSEEKSRLVRYRNKLKLQIARNRQKRAKTKIVVDHTKLKYHWSLTSSMSLIIGLILNVSFTFCLMKYAVFF